MTVVGEMSLCSAGTATPRPRLQLERAWDDLTRGLPFLTVCFYSLECFREGQTLNVFPGICGSTLGGLPRTRRIVVFQRISAEHTAVSSR